MNKKNLKNNVTKSEVITKIALSTQTLLIIIMASTIFIGYSFAALSMKNILRIKPAKQSLPVPEVVFNEESDGNLTWNLVWQDEFDYDGLPDSSKWDFEEGYVRNDEPQYYTRADINNAYVHDGYLSITTRKDKELQYTSASLTTLNKAHFIYGVFEIRAKLPAGQGSWPTFWLLGKNVMQMLPAGDHIVGLEERGGEIDIMEHWGVWPNQYSPAVHVLNGPGNVHNVHEVVETSSNLSETWHTYKLKWSPDRLDFYFDDHIVYSYHKTADVAWPFDFEHYIILNNALKSENIDLFTDFPMEFQVDYVRVYSAKPECDDGIDNDGDGQVDLQDSLCHNEFSLTEHRPECDDGVDNDGDGFMDYYQDGNGCFDTWETELDDCFDGLDNDADGFIDYPNDPSCVSQFGPTESPECDDGLDNDADGFIDYPNDPSCPNRWHLYERHDDIECDDGLDNDGDGFIDYPNDTGCRNASHDFTEEDDYIE